MSFMDDGEGEKHSYPDEDDDARTPLRQEFNGGFYRSEGQE